ncbi:helix-turn-helix domain-containing protein [uncultured Acetobacteroides sp.]|uniref:helix-turn-helix domain-containing protein n=1 Tax=uncultured Acetobacteroides sp. TaxID=1760811 RepID=UPI0029F5192A|nr:helix-turn-helix domain-containing protein [uncultured Acetobacteroides sp.]
MQDIKSIEDLIEIQKACGISSELIDNSTLHSDGGTIYIIRREDFYNKQVPYSRRDFFKISLMIGDGTLCYASKGIKIDQAALVFFNPLVPYAWETVSENQSGYCCLFTEEFVTQNKLLNDSPFFKIGADPVFFLSEQQKATLSILFEKMLAEIGSEYRYKSLLLQNYLELIVHEALKMKPSDSYFTYTDASTRITNLFLELLERQFPVDPIKHPLKLKAANDFACSLSVHVNHLNRAVKEITNHTTSWHIADRVIREARLLLKNTDWSIADVAYSLGFEYPAYFNSFFKKQTGLTPLIVRK